MMASTVSLRAGPPATRIASQWSSRTSQHIKAPCRHLSSGRSRLTSASAQAVVHDEPDRIPVPEAPRIAQSERRAAIKNAKPFSEFLTDSFNRKHDYLRISVTERCNLRCLYCMPEEGVQLSPPAHLLTSPEIIYLASLFVSQGVTKIRLTGGEPTVRRDIVPLMHSIGNLRPKGLRELAITTNGISLHRKLDSMAEAGLTGVNLSLDTLDPFQFQIMTRRNGFDAVMRCIDRILEMNRLGANIKLKINCVVMRGLNERDIIPFVEMGREKNIEVRFIEYMPFGGNKWSQGKMMGYQEMLDIIRTKYPDIRPVPGHKNDTSKTYEVPGFVGKVGFITSMTNDFCGTCNRLRITGDGNLKVCLHGNAEVSLRDLLRQDNNGQPIDEEAFERIRQVEISRREGRLSDETTLGWGQRERELLNVIGAAVKRKAEKHADMGDLENMENRPMILIGPPYRNESTVTLSSNQGYTLTSYTTPRPLPSSHSLPFLFSSTTPPPASFVRAYSTSSMQNEARPEVPESNHLRSAVNEEIALAQAIEKAANNLARTSTSTKDASQDVPPTQEAAPQTPPSPKPRTNKPRELHPSDLRSERSLSGIQAIDDELTVNFDSDIADLQSQIYRLQERIKTSYPRMERLPYEVWKSSNKTTLRLWLKILTRKWERRFEAVGNVDDGDDVAMLLDEMVKAHKLDNDAAERMVQLYREIAEKRVRYMAKNVVEPGMEWLEEGDQDEYSVPTERKRVGKEGSITKARSPFKYSFLTGSGTQHKNTLKENTAVPKQQLRHYSFNPKSNDPNTPPTSTTATPKQTTLPHLTSTGAAHMVSVSAKPATSRTAVAAGIVYFSNPAPLSLIRSNSLKKGDVLSVARIAGIMAAKQCPTLIPLCHPIALSHAGVVLRLVNSSKEGENEAEKKGYGGVEIKATVQCIGPTGVEMEALTAVMGAALTVVDMCKAVDKGMRVQDVRVVKKEGGRSGTWLEEGWREWSEE